MILSLLPVAFALPCSKLDGKDLEICNEILESDAEEQEKQQLIADLTYKDVDLANHSLVYDWNTDISFSSAPNGVETKSSGYIYDAWLKIIAIMPSVLLDGKLLSSGNGKIQSAYNYRVQIPSGTESGDCFTRHSLISNDAWLNVYLNDKNLGTSTLLEFDENGILNFKDTLRIKTVTEVNHYKKERKCIRRYRSTGRCYKWREVCRYSYTDYRTHEVNLEDTKTAYQYSPLIGPEIKAVDSYRNTNVGLLNISNFDAFELEFENSSFSQYNYNYDVDVSLQPYNVHTLRANKFAKKIQDNLVIEQDNSSYKFYVSDADNCKLRYYDHFRSSEQSCNLDYNFQLFEIKTDKLQYNENETIEVILEPKDIAIRVRYGNDEITALNTAQFKAKSNQNKITAFLEGRKAERVIHVKKENTWNFAINFGVFTGILYFYYSIFKKYVLWM